MVMLNTGWTLENGGVSFSLYALFEMTSVIGKGPIHLSSIFFVGRVQPHLLPNLEDSLLPPVCIVKSSHVLCCLSKCGLCLFRCLLDSLHKLIDRFRLSRKPRFSAP